MYPEEVISSLTILPLVIAGIMLYVGAVHTYLFSRLRRRREHLTFTLTCGCMAVLSIATAGMYAAGSVAAAVEWQRARTAMLSLLTAAFVWFLMDYVEGESRSTVVPPSVSDSRKIVWALSIFHIVAALVQVFDRSSLTWQVGVVIVHRVRVPMGGVLTYPVAASGPWTYLQVGGVLITFLYGLVIGIRFYRQGNRQRGEPLPVALGLLMLLGVVYDVVVFYGGRPSVYQLEQVSLAVVPLMTYSLSSTSSTVVKAAEVQEALREKERQSQALSESLRRSEALLRLLMENLPLNVFSKDLEGRFTFANRQYCTTENRSLEEIIGKTDFDLHPPDLARKYREDDRYVIETGQTWKFVEIHQPLEGEPRYVQVIKAPLYDANGALAGMLGIFWDVTEQKKAYVEIEELVAVRTEALQQEIAERKRVEEALCRSEERYRAVAETAVAGLEIVDEEGRFVWLNQAMAHMLGYTPEELIGRSLSEFVDAETFADYQRRTEQRRLYGLQSVHEDVVYHRDGHPIHLLVSASPLRDQNGEFEGTIGVVVDITERKKAEAALKRAYAEVELQVEARTAELRKEIEERRRVEKELRRSEARYRTLVTQAPIGILTCDHDGRVLHFNPAILEIIGLDDGDAFRQCNLLTHPTAVEIGFAADLRRSLTDQVAIQAEYYHRLKPDDHSHVSQVHITPLRSDGGHMNGALILAEDVTEQRRLEEQLTQSAKLASIGELAAGVAHEINNPINGIINYAQVLLNEARSRPSSALATDRETRFLEGILREGNRVANIVRDLLTFARVETEEHSPARVPDILRDALALTNQQLQKDGIQLRIEIVHDLPPVRCRSQRIQQVFLNLISNARHALNARYPPTATGWTPAEKQLSIRVEQVERGGVPYIRTTFHDRGVGIPEEHLPRLFTPFFTTKRPGEGTGLGLSVSYGIIKDHDGEIEVESVVGSYTVFRVDLPVDVEYT